MSIQIEFDWASDNLQQTIHHLLKTRPAQWTQYLEEGQEPTFDLFNEILFKKLRRHFDAKDRQKVGSEVEQLSKPVWICYVLSDKISMDGNDQLFGNFRIHGHLKMLESGVRATRVVTYDSSEQRMIAVNLVLLTRL